MAQGDRYVGAIESFKGQIKSIQRASLFDVEIPNFRYAQNYTGGNTNYILSFGVKTATFPNTNVGDIDVKYMGRSIHWYGDRTFNASWATTCILDGQWQIFNAIYAWHQGIGGAERIVSEDLVNWEWTGAAQMLLLIWPLLGCMTTFLLSTPMNQTLLQERRTTPFPISNRRIKNQCFKAPREPKGSLFFGAFHIKQQKRRTKRSSFD